MLGDEKLWASDVVANCDMNRLRRLDGPNSYTRELGFNPLDLNPKAWLDLCFGSGRALIEASRRTTATLIGVDLVDAFDDVDAAGKVDDRAGPDYTGQPAVTSHYGPPTRGPRPRPTG